MDKLKNLPLTITQLFHDMESDSSIAKQNVTVMGWVKSCRNMAKKTFLTIFDGSSDVLQVVLTNEILDNIPTLVYHDGVQITGIIKQSPAKGQKWELHANKLQTFKTTNVDKSYDSKKILTVDNGDTTVLADVDDATGSWSYPLHCGRDAMSIDLLRQYGHLAHKDQYYQAIGRIRDVLSMATHTFFHKYGFKWVHTPIITQSDCEGAGEAFQLCTDGGDLESFFSKNAYLTVSGQLHGESLALAHGRIYTFGPTFREEHSTTSRHLSEFWMIEPELLLDGLDQLLILIESYVQYCITTALDKCLDDIEYLSKKTDKPITDILLKSTNHNFKRITYTDAIQLLQTKAPDDLFISIIEESVKYSEAGSVESTTIKRNRPKWGDDLCSEDEKWLVKHLGGFPVMVTHYPASFKSFYMLPTEGCSNDKQTVDCVDLLVPGVGELVGGSMRDHDYDRLHRTMIDRIGEDFSAYNWYLDLRRHGSLPHGGFGLGFERLVMLCTGAPIRDTIPFPRAYKKLKH